MVKEVLVRVICHGSWIGVGEDIKYLSYRHTLTSNINRVGHGSESHESADHGGEDEEDTRQAAGGGGVVVTRVTECGVAQAQGVLLILQTVR